MATDNHPAERADAIFAALNTSEAEEQANEVAAIEAKEERFERIREQAEMRD